MTKYTEYTESTVRAGRRFRLDPKAQWAELWRDWRLMGRRETIAADVLAGVSVALVALPLSLAIASASGVKPEIGLVTAAVGGIVVALFGGCRLQVSGPAAAMTFLVYEIVTKFGMAGLVAATVLAGLLQVASGFFRLGRFMQFIPRPVVAGFLTGIGITIFCTQLPVILGYEVGHSEEGGALALLWQTVRQIGLTEPTTFAVGLTAVVLMLVLPRVSRKLPTPLIAVAAATLLPVVFGWSRVGLLGPLPRQFPLPSLPVVPWDRWNELVMAALAIFVLASLESLLSASVVDSLSKSKTTKVDNDQELVGQGLGNLASALFGGLPVTGVIARSATNIQAGGRTRLSAIVHAAMLLVMMFGLASLVALIPRAALAGVLIAVALRMIEVHLLGILWRSNRAEAAVFLATAGAIIVTDLIVGVPVGLAAAFIYVVTEMSKLDVRQVPLVKPEAGGDDDGTGCNAVRVMQIDGPLFFASGYHLRSVVNRLNGVRCVAFDLSRVPFLDVTGAETLEEAAEALQRRQVLVLLVHPSESVLRRLRNLSSHGLPALRDCPVLDSLREAMRLAASETGPDSLCRSCEHRGDCAGLTTALEAFEARSENPTPCSHTLGLPVKAATEIAPA